MKNLFAISGPSGTGKTTLCRGLQKKLHGVSFSVSCTTRKKRFNEIDGQDYHFISIEEFTEDISNNKFIEYETVHGDYYGTLKKTVEDSILNKKLLLLEVDVKGAKTIKCLYPDNLVTIFILPPSLDNLQNRLINRGTDSDTRIKKRLNRLELELKEKDWFDYHIINNEIENATREFITIIEKQTIGVFNEPKTSIFQQNG